MKKLLIVTPFISIILLFVLLRYATYEARSLQIHINTPAIYSMFYGNANAAMIPPAVIPGMVYVKGDAALNISSFYIGQYEVTQKEWIDIMGHNPSHFKGDSLPVENISWLEAIEYCNKRSLKEGLTPVYHDNDDIAYGNGITIDPKADGYRLPTAAEWEYAANGGNKSSITYAYSGSEDIASVGWYEDNSEHTTHPVGSKMANSLGAYDMSGNVSEWCWDWYNERTIPDVFSGNGRVVRGGGWDEPAHYLQLDNWATEHPAHRFNSVGLRVVRGL